MLQKINKKMVNHSYYFADESFVENYKEDGKWFTQGW